MNSTSLSIAAGRDANGNPITADAATIELYDRAIDRLLRFDPEAVDIATDLAGEDSPVPMAHAADRLPAPDEHRRRRRRDGADMPRRRPRRRNRQRPRAGPRRGDRRMGRRATGRRGAPPRRPARALADRPAGAAARPPARLLPRRRRRTCATVRCARCASSTRRIRTRRSCAAWPRSASRRRATTAQALDAGLAAVDANPDDVWAIHAVVHTYEMQGTVDEGIALPRGPTRRAGRRGNLFTVHNWWHLALYHLEAGRPERALAIYDAEVHHAGVARRADRDARRQRAAVAAAARRRRHR